MGPEGAFLGIFLQKFAYRFLWSMRSSSIQMQHNFMSK